MIHLGNVLDQHEGMRCCNHDMHEPWSHCIMEECAAGTGSLMDLIIEVKYFFRIGLGIS